MLFSSSTLIRLDKDAFEGHLCQTVNNYVKQNELSLPSPLRKVAGDLDRGRFRPRLGGGKRGVRMRVFIMGCESWGV